MCTNCYRVNLYAFTCILWTSLYWHISCKSHFWSISTKVESKLREFGQSCALSLKILCLWITFSCWININRTEIMQSFEETISKDHPYKQQIKFKLISCAGGIPISFFLFYIYIHLIVWLIKKKKNTLDINF